MHLEPPVIAGLSQEALASLQYLSARLGKRNYASYRGARLNSPDPFERIRAGLEESLAQLGMRPSVEANRPQAGSMQPEGGIATISDAWLDEFEKRAAIMQYDGGLSRHVAERFAREIMELGDNPSPEAIASLDARLRAADARAE